jgi:hypothetical protein
VCKGIPSREQNGKEAAHRRYRGIPLARGLTEDKPYKKHSVTGTKIASAIFEIIIFALFFSKKRKNTPSGVFFKGVIQRFSA